MANSNSPQPHQMAGMPTAGSHQMAGSQTGGGAAAMNTSQNSNDSRILEKKLEEIRERLRMTESQLVEERNAKNALTQKVCLYTGVCTLLMFTK